MSDMFDGLNNSYFDILKELGNIGSGNAITALSKMIDKKVEMTVPIVQFLDFNDLASAIGGPENYVAGILVNLTGDLNGIMMFLVAQQGAEKLLNELFFGGIEREREFEFGELETSALTELGNILTNSYLSSLANMLNMEIKPSVPSMAIDMAGAILSVPAIEFGKVSDKVLFIDTIFSTKGMDIDGYFILVPEFESFKAIMTKLGVI